MMLASPAIETPRVEQAVARPISIARWERLTLGAVVLLYLCSVVSFAIATPYGEAPDETLHLLYVEHLVRFDTLPEIRPQPYSAEAVQPPLYYLVGAGLVLAGRWVVRDPQPQSQIAPFVGGNPKWRDGHSYAVMVHPAAERWPPWAYLLRAYSILLGLGVVLLTYATVRTLIPPPAPATAPLIATAFAALLPQANFIRASVSNENLAALVGAWIIFLLVQHLVRPYAGRRVFWLGVALGLGLITKLSLAPLLLPALAVLWLRRADQPRRLGRDLLGIGAILAVLAGPFYLFRWIVYGNPLATAAWTAMLPTDSHWRLTDFFWMVEPFRTMLWTSFWGVYGWQQIWMPEWIYVIFGIVTLVAILGGVGLIVRRALTPVQWVGSGVMLITLYLAYAVVIVISLRLIAWQGREMFSALSSIAGLFGLGLAGLVLGRAAVQPGSPVARWRRWAAAALVPAVALGLFAVNLYSVVGLVWPLLNTP